MAFKQNLSVAVVGLGYVGLPVAVAFGKRSIPTIGFDINAKKINELKRSVDATQELTRDELCLAKSLTYTHNPEDLKKANFIIVAVPTPVTKANKPDLRLIEKASQLVGQNLSKKTIVVYESTVYPGVTEEVCVPVLERESGLKCGKDFNIGYSPERINPGDKEHTLEKIVKVVAGQDATTTEQIAQVYGLVCDAGVFKAANIKTAEAAKVIENTQRDLNIALMNELSLIFHRIGINTYDVLEAAGTKWNFLNFTPGLVGGHCIGVDPYYLVQKAEELGYHPQVIAAGRRVNDSMSVFVAELVVTSLIQAGKNIQKSNVLIMGLTFKENVNDSRNSKISGTITKLKELGITVVGYDPFLSQTEISSQFGITGLPNLSGTYDAIVLATPHTSFLDLDKKELQKHFHGQPIFIDIKQARKDFSNQKKIIYKSL